MKLLDHKTSSGDKRRLHEREKDRIEEFRGAIQTGSMLLALPLVLLSWFMDLVYALHMKWHFLAFRSALIPIALSTYFFSKRVKTLAAMQTLGVYLALGVGVIITSLIFGTD